MPSVGIVTAAGGGYSENVRVNNGFAVFSIFDMGVILEEAISVAKTARQLQAR